MRALGARGYVSPEQLKKTERFLAANRRQKQRDKIAALSDRDIQFLMAAQIVAAVTARGCVVERDFLFAAVPQHRIEKNLDAAMRQARKDCPDLDRMLAAGRDAA